MNEQHRTTAPSSAASTRSYEAAFVRLEGPISDLLLATKTQTVLLDGIFPGCDPKSLTGDQNEAICHMAEIIRRIADELDGLWLDAWNEQGAPVVEGMVA